jgi:FMN phosphatase YigB (HAD superfamily)
MRAAKPMSKLLGIPASKIFKVIGKDREFIVFCELDNSPSQYWSLAAKKLGLKGLPVSKMNKLWNKIFWPNKPILRALPKLKKRYKLGLISNMAKSHEKHHKSKNNITKPFDVAIFSCSVNLRKPNPKIYKLALKKLKVRPKEAVFIDDIPRNIKAAKKLGIHAIHYKNHKQVFRDLGKLGVKIK